MFSSIRPAVGSEPLRVLCSVFTLEGIVANSAHTHVLARTHPNDILRGKLMTVLAMRFGRMTGGDSFAPKQVNSLRYRLKMGWINTRGISAQMIDNKTCGDWPINDLPREPMLGYFRDLFRAAVVNSKISLGVCWRSMPAPTFLWVGCFDESFKVGSKWLAHANRLEKTYKSVNR